MTEDNIRFFEDTCSRFDLRTCSDPIVLGTKFIDPCSCYRYFQCTQDYKMKPYNCPDGTAWDYKTNGCIHSEEVMFNQNCSRTTNVWTRCNVTETRVQELKVMCTNKSTTLPTSTTAQPTPRLEPSTVDKINPGIIIGSIIGGALIAIIVLIVAFFLYRRKKKNSVKKQRKGTIAHNPEYFENGNADDPYSSINDNHVIPDTQMSDPTYNGTVTAGTISQLNGICANAGFDSMGEDVEYDNSGARIVGSEYTSTLNRSFREYDTPIRANQSRELPKPNETGNEMTTTTNQSSNVQSKGNLYVDLNGNKNNLENENIGITDGCDSEGAEGESSGAHDYYTLKKMEDVP